MTEDKIFELAERLADEAYGYKGRYLYSERQELTVKFNSILLNEFKNLSKGAVIGALPNLCNHWFVQRDMYWQSCQHCGFQMPVGQ